MSLTIYHNPRCSKSRKSLEMIVDSGVDHKVVTYLDEMPSADQLLNISAALGMKVIDFMRRNEDEFKQADDLPDLADDAALAAWLVEHPIVLERPIVVDDATGAAVIGRPPENLNALLPK